jgi:hypothetical protein
MKNAPRDARRVEDGHDGGVNFLLHRYLAEAKVGSRSAGAGAMLPDLWRMADRRVRARASEEGSQPAAAGVDQEVLAGIAHHIEIDRWFHADAVFIEGERLVRARVREAGVEAPRMGLLAHPVWEMCLDGALLRRVGLASTLAAVREGFVAIAGEPEERAAEVHHWGKTLHGPEERAQFEARMAKLREEVARGPWIEGYQDGEGLAIRVAGVRARLGLPALSVEDRARLGEALDSVAGAADAAVEEILERAGR